MKGRGPADRLEATLGARRPRRRGWNKKIRRSGSMKMGLSVNFNVPSLAKAFDASRSHPNLPDLRDLFVLSLSLEPTRRYTRFERDPTAYQRAELGACGACNAAASRRSTRLKAGNLHAQIATTMTVPIPPRTTEGTRPSHCAVTPDSNSPSSLLAPMNTILT